MDYTEVLNLILGRLNSILDVSKSISEFNNLLFLLIAALLILFVIRGE